MYSVTSPFVYWQEIYDKLRRQNPEYKQISISSGTASVSFNRFGNQRASDRYSFNTDNGEFTETSLYQHQDKSERFVVGFYSVHVGTGEECLLAYLLYCCLIGGCTTTDWILFMDKKTHKGTEMNESFFLL